MRCIRTVKALRVRHGWDLSTLALYTPPDRDAPFVRHADRALALPVDSTPVAAYLDRERLVEQLLEAGADAVWPGWGFLAEDPVFVERLLRHGIRFLGPSPEAMRQLGDKISAKQIAERLGIPVTPWSRGVVSDVASACRVAESLGYPVVIKASAGGGGRGIRMVNDPASLVDSFRAASSEALNAFGDGRLFLEHKISGGRHIEVQIAADLHSNVRIVGCRDCSVQRRHQKLIEESPPSGLSRALDASLRRAAEAVAREVTYSGVGTVEFLVEDDRYQFLEMNPRLQVEHGVTEQTTGLDLVEIQIRIARGESLERLEVKERGVAIEVRICAEDPDADFLPSPGRIARFDPALGPGIRLDTGVTPGSMVPREFDSLLAKLIATGSDREEARARLITALGDFDLLVEGGATNKAFLIDILKSAGYCRGSVDTGWLDRFTRSEEPPFAVEALVGAVILSYQRNRRDALTNFYADTANLAPERVPASIGQQIDLTCRGEAYRLDVLAIGGWNYRVHLDGRSVEANLREAGSHLARLQLGGRCLRLLYDLNGGLRLEVEGVVHRFGLQQAGQVRAATPAMVVAIQVKERDSVEVGQSIGILEAMKMEIAFRAPISGIVAEVLVRAGQQVSAGEILLLIEPSEEKTRSECSERLRFHELPDPLDPLFRGSEVHLPATDRSARLARRAALGALRQEVRGVLLGYDVTPQRAERLAAFLEAPLPVNLSVSVRRRLAEIRYELTVAADIDELFRRLPSRSPSGELGPSNSARLRMYVRRIRAGGSGIDEEFLAGAAKALKHYGILGLEFSRPLERAVVRLLATQRSRALRDRLLLAILNRLRMLARQGADFGEDEVLREVLGRIGQMRGLVPDSVADAAIQTAYEIFQRPEIEARALKAIQRMERLFSTAEGNPTALSDTGLLEMASAPEKVFSRIREWLGAADPRRRSLAVAAYLRRLYAPAVPLPCGRAEGSLTRLEFSDGRIVVGLLVGSDADFKSGILQSMADTARPRRITSIEILVTTSAPADLAERVLALDAEHADQIVISTAVETTKVSHRTFVRKGRRFLEEDTLFGIHPEVAARLDLARFRGFKLERHLAGDEGIYRFSGESRELPADERLFVLADIPGFASSHSQSLDEVLARFEQSFHEATRSLRELRALRDPARRLLWNRITIALSSTVRFDPGMAEPIARRLAPAARRLGLEKVIVRLDTISPDACRRSLEIEVSDVTGMNLQLRIREPHHDALRPRSNYERKVVEARRRGLLYPYEIVRMLTEKDAGETDLPADVKRGSTFEEFDLDPSRLTPVARSVANRPYGENRAAVVFGIISTPTEKFPKGMRRVLLLSDPTIGMGALAAPECDRIIAAIDLAEQLSVPVEWIPISSGARIALDSGTENLDATARVARRIITFTQAGGVIHILVYGVNVGAQSYFNALATMLTQTKGALVMTTGGSMVLTGRVALEASGAVSAEDEIAIGGLERVMGPNGEAQYSATNLAEAYGILFEHYRYSYVAPGEAAPRAFVTADPVDRDICAYPCNSDGFSTVGEIFHEATNPGRKKAFPMRTVMAALADQDGGWLERWAPMVGAETAVVWDAHIGGWPVSLLGIESMNVTREGYRPLDGPPSWTGGTLFPLSSKKIARAIQAASRNRPMVILATLSGFDGSPESMRKLQLEYGAEIARAIVNFAGPIFFVVVSRYHGGAYVVFSQELNDHLVATALTGSYASVIGGSAAAAVVFPREVRSRTLNDPRLECRGSLESRSAGSYERLLEEILLEKRAELAAEFDRIHSVDRARAVGSISAILEPRTLRPWLVGRVRAWYENAPISR